MATFLRLTGILFLIIAFFGVLGSKYITHQTYFALVALIGFVNLGFSKLINIFENKIISKNIKKKKYGIIGYFLGD